MTWSLTGDWTTRLARRRWLSIECRRLISTLLIILSYRLQRKTCSNIITNMNQSWPCVFGSICTHLIARIEFQKHIVIISVCLQFRLSLVYTIYSEKVLLYANFNYHMSIFIVNKMLPVKYDWYGSGYKYCILKIVVRSCIHRKILHQRTAVLNVTVVFILFKRKYWLKE